MYLMLVRFLPVLFWPYLTKETKEMVGHTAGSKIHIAPHRVELLNISLSAELEIGSSLTK